MLCIQFDQHCEYSDILSSRLQCICRGPHENYIDRQDGAPVRLYSADVSTLHTPYVAPSENGGRGGTRWVALMPQQVNSVSSSQPGGGPGSTQAAGGCPVVLAAAVPVSSSESCQPWPQDGGDTGQAPQVGAAFCPRDGLHFSASHHSTEDLFAAKHNHELPEGGPCYLHLDGMHMGIGGDDSWTPSVCSLSMSLITQALFSNAGLFRSLVGLTQ